MLNPAAKAINKINSLWRPVKTEIARLSTLAITQTSIIIKYSLKDYYAKTG